MVLLWDSRETIWWPNMNYILRVSHFEDETTRDRLISWQVDWVLVIASHCFQVVSSAIASGVFLELYSSFHHKFIDTKSHAFGV